MQLFNFSRDGAATKPKAKGQKPQRQRQRQRQSESSMDSREDSQERYSHIKMSQDEIYNCDSINPVNALFVESKTRRYRVKVTKNEHNEPTLVFEDKRHGTHTYERGMRLYKEITIASDKRRLNTEREGETAVNGRFSYSGNNDGNGFESQSQSQSQSQHQIDSQLLIKTQRIERFLILMDDSLKSIDDYVESIVNGSQNVTRNNKRSNASLQCIEMASLQLYDDKIMEALQFGEDKVIKFVERIYHKYGDLMSQNEMNLKRIVDAHTNFMLTVLHGKSGPDLPSVNANYTEENTQKGMSMIVGGFHDTSQRDSHVEKNVDYYSKKHDKMRRENRNENENENGNFNYTYADADADALILNYGETPLRKSTSANEQYTRSINEGRNAFQQQENEVNLIQNTRLSSDGAPNLCGDDYEMH